MNRNIYPDMTFKQHLSLVDTAEKAFHSWAKAYLKEPSAFHRDMLDRARESYLDALNSYEGVKPSWELS